MTLMARVFTDLSFRALFLFWGTQMTLMTQVFTDLSFRALFRASKFLVRYFPFSYQPNFDETKNGKGV
jgi:hypothetical protein